MSLFLLFLCLLALPTLAPAATLQVGPTRSLTTPAAAAAIAQDGDLIEIDAGAYLTGAAIWKANNLTVRGVGGLAHIQGASLLGKGLWVIQGMNTTVEFVEFVGATVPDGNGAGIRQEGDTLTVRHCRFLNNQNGILTGNQGANRTSDILIEYSEFSGNGAGDGLTHNLYVGEVRTLTFQYNWSHDSNGGQLVKSRAATNYILYNRLVDTPGGASNYELDLSNGGVAYVIGNIIRQDPNTNNSAMFTYAPEGPATNPTHELYLINNTFIQDRFAGIPVQIRGTLAVQKILNNLFVGSGAPLWLNGTLPPLPPGNLITEAPQFLDRPSQNYHPTVGTPGVNQGIDPGSANGVTLQPPWQYLHPTTRQARTLQDTVLDIGAYELGILQPNALPTVPILTGGIVSATALWLNWTSSVSEAHPIAGYRLLRNGALLATTTTLHYTDTALAGKEAYTYTVQAVDAAGQVSAVSNAVTLTLPRLLTALPIPPEPGWYELANTTLSAVCYDKPPFTAGGCRGVIDEWNSGTFDTKRNRLILWGGGHGGYTGNELYALNLDTLSVERLTDPGFPLAPGNCTPSPDNPDCIPAYPPGSGCMESVANGTQPNTRHTYDGVAYLTHLDQMFVFGGALACTSGGAGRNTWIYDFATKQWQRKRPTGNIPRGFITATAYNPHTKQVLIHDSKCLHTYDPATDTYTLLPGGYYCHSTLEPSDMTGYHFTGILDPERQLFFTLQQGAQNWMYDVNPASPTYGNITAFPTPGWGIGAYPGLAYDPISKHILGWNGGDTVYRLDIDTKTWTPLHFPGGAGAVSTGGNGTFKRWAYSPKFDAFVVINAINRNAFVFRAPHGEEKPPPPCDDTCQTCGIVNACGRLCQGCPQPPPIPRDVPGGFVQRKYSDETWLRCTASGPQAAAALTWVLGVSPP